MSAWRRVAIAKIPRFRKLIEEAESVWMLWVDLWCQFVKAHADPLDEELIGQVYDYAWWCANSPDPDTRTAGVLSFYEDLPTRPEVRAQMAKWLSPERFSGMGEIFRYHLDSFEDYQRFVQEFYQRRSQLGEAAAGNTEEPLTDEQFQARVAEAVASLREGERTRGTLAWEFLARAYVVNNKPVMEQLAPALRQCSGGAHAIAAAIGPILRSLAAAGAVPFPTDPVTVAAAALVLAARRSAPRRAAAERKRQRPSG
jgi:hypothetical protein